MGGSGGEADGEDEPWTWERAKAFADSCGELKARFINHFVSRPYNGHAYGPHDLAQLRRILSLDENAWPDTVLHEHTDTLVILTARAFVITPQEGAKIRLQRLNSKLLTPTRKLLMALQDEEFAREYVQDGSPLTEEDRQQLIESVTVFKANLEKHIAEIKDAGRRGKAWDSDLKDRFVTYVDWMCEFLDNNFEPKRAVDAGSEDHSHFGKCVYLLARPLKWSSDGIRPVGFDGAIRKHVDQWRSSIFRVAQELEDERNGRDGENPPPSSSM
ncbi:hypothetical protein [Rhizobium oryzicola]|uniref:Uncharacterized protein n=1 Tax=Rhizobium oryzicola TaxID=1232668 RepID=A0ABT8SRD2_9HYPH|nr:hypothetical protein [Rhizobium oryzicola]MDO1580974.1 hypothetical protein [Rhizobium oryzicola]